MIQRVYCQRCAQVFAFETTEAPAQRAIAKRRRGPGPIVAYYPSCPRCHEKIEFTEPKTPGASAAGGRFQS